MSNEQYSPESWGGGDRRIKDTTPPVRYTIIWTGLLVGLGFFVADIIIDVFVFRSGTLIEETLNPTGHEMWMRTSVVLVAVAFALYVQFLLGREHKTSERVKTAERFLNSVFDNIPSMVFIKDASDLRFIRVNHTGEQLLGLTTQELVGKSDYEFFPESQAEFFIRKDREVFESGVKLEIPEEEIDTTQGKRWLHTRKVPIFDEEGQPIYLLGISEDITEARQASLALKQTEIRYQTLFESAADFIFVIDNKGNVLETNRYTCDKSGYERHEIVGEKIEKHFTRESQEYCDYNLPILIERGHNSADFEFVCKDGRVLLVECSATAVPDENGDVSSYLIIQRDVTEKKQAEKEIHLQQRNMAHVMRLSTMGEMASGLAHELNQPLTALTSYCGTAATLVKDLPSPPQQLGDILERAKDQAHRASQIIRHLRDFLAKADDHQENLDLDQVIAGMIDFIKPELKNGHVKIEHHPGARGCKVLANKIQIEQVLVNLVLNSLEAIKGSGKTTGNIIVRTRQLPNEMIETTVADDGPGIDADIAGRMFNPFQTSKPSGMGMGLTISQSIIEGYAGKLWADVQRKNGALFGFNLPVCE
jgi:two-component system, cell cycle sensor histidine kinase and response regulator CckA